MGTRVAIAHSAAQLRVAADVGIASLSPRAAELCYVGPNPNPTEMDADSELSDLLDDLGEVIDLSRQDASMRSFMLDACELIRGVLPEEAASWLQTANEYAAGIAGASELTQARVDAWHYLGTESCNFKDQRVNAVRALICLLFPREERQDGYETLSHFIQFANDAEPHAGEQILLLRRAFAEVLS